MNSVLNIDNKLFLSYQYLKGFDIKQCTIDSWKKRDLGERLYIGKNAFIAFEDIPTTTRKKLPSKEFLLQQLVCDKKESELQSYINDVKSKVLTLSVSFRREIKDKYNHLSDKDALVEAWNSALRKVIKELTVEFSNDKGNLRDGKLIMLHEIYKALHKGRCKSKHAFSATIKACKSAGFDAVVVDKRKLTTGNNKKYGAEYQALVLGLFSVGKAGNGGTEIHRQLLKICAEKNIPCPSVSMVKNWVSEFANHNETLTHYGKDKTQKTMPYASLQPALHANKQWQADGFTIGIYCKNTDGKIIKLVIFWVVDAYSGKIVGYYIGQSENREVILLAYQDAVKKTGVIAPEIVTDNHAFNRSKEGENFIMEAQKIGVTFTATYNPQYKNIVERLGKTFDKVLAGYAIVKGQGIKSRNKHAHTTPELIYEYLKTDNILSADETKLIIISAVKEYNTTALYKNKKSPEQLYNESEKPICYELDMYEQARLFINKANYKISRNQINIIIAGTKYEYLLSAKYYERYNGKMVSVRYESTDLIYLFDIKTDKPICTVKQKPKIHGAKVDQTEADILLLNKHAGMVKGIIAQSRKKSENLINKALEVMPDFYEVLHHATTPKDVLQEAETDYEIRQEAERMGIDLSRVTTVPKVTEITNPTYLGKKETRKERSPFMPKNHTIRILEPNYNTDDE